MTLTVGVLGVGHLMAHVVPGLMRATAAPQILLSARNAERARSLSERFGLEICSDNEELTARSDVVIVAVRPFDVVETIKGLPWRKSQTVLSFAGTVSHSDYAPHVNGAKIALAMPVITAEFGESPTSIWPANSLIQTLLEPCGPVIAFQTEAQFKAASGSGAYFGWVQALILEMTKWLSAKGVPEDEARALIAGMTRAGAVSAFERTDTPLSELIEDLCLPGSLTGQGLEILQNVDAFSPWRAAADSIYERHMGDK
ncbi:MAG: NAD(P)-binding domain-containing protein [Pseudomonadota bacterium]